MQAAHVRLPSLDVVELIRGHAGVLLMPKTTELGDGDAGGNWKMLSRQVQDGLDFTD